MPYTPLEWKDGPEGGTPISAANLNRMEQGIKDAHDQIDGATNEPTANALVRRDIAGRARFADPSHAQDAATKGWVEATRRQVAILTGAFDRSGTIPLPSGFTEEQCKWWVGVTTASRFNPNTGSTDPFPFSVSWSQTSRTVSSNASAPNDTLRISYTIIGVK